MKRDLHLRWCHQSTAKSRHNMFQAVGANNKGGILQHNNTAGVGIRRSSPPVLHSLELLAEVIIVLSCSVCKYQSAAFLPYRATSSSRHATDLLLYITILRFTSIFFCLIRLNHSSQLTPGIKLLELSTPEAAVCLLHIKPVIRILLLPQLYQLVHRVDEAALMLTD